MTHASCLEFGYAAAYASDVTVNLYIDSSGGDPNYDDMMLFKTTTTKVFSTANWGATHSVSVGDAAIDFPSPHATLVVEVKFPARDATHSGDGHFGFGFEDASHSDQSTGTFIGGSCIGNNLYSHKYVWNNFYSQTTSVQDRQWYVSLTGPLPTREPTTQPSLPGGTNYPTPTHAPSSETAFPTMEPTAMPVVSNHGVCNAATGNNVEALYDDWGSLALGYQYTDCGTTNPSSVFRAFDQSQVMFGSASCLEVGYATDVNYEINVMLYIDTNGGEPDYDHFELLRSYTTVLPHTSAGDTMYVNRFTMSLNDVHVEFNDPNATLVVQIQFPGRNSSLADAKQFGEYMRFLFFLMILFIFLSIYIIS